MGTSFGGFQLLDEKNKIIIESEIAELSYQKFIE